MMPNVGSESDIIVLDVGGTIFRVHYSTISRYSEAKLCKLVDKKKANYDNQIEELRLFVDRSSKYFKFILEVHRMGKLHLTHGLCWHRLREELEFWELDARASLSPCCVQRVLDQEERQYMASYLEKQLEDSCAPDVLSAADVHSCSLIRKCEKYTRQVWLFLEDPTSSIIAQVWAVLFLMVVLSSVFVQIALSHQIFRRDIPNPKWDIANETNAKVLMFATSEVLPFIWRLENMCLSVFGIELLLRFAVCPHKLNFFKSLYNLVDILCIVPMLLMLVVETYHTQQDKKNVFMVSYILSMFSVFRILRLFKFLRQFLCVRVLLLALKASLREVALLLMLLIVGMLVFSNLIYFAELHVEDQFESVTIGFWWSIVTMTTVGYGDKHPKSAWGYVIGALCAVCGMLLIGIPIPAIANNFNMLYAMARRKRMARPKEGSTFATTLQTLMNIPGSKLLRLVRSHATSSNDGQNLFLDRDPMYFGYILSIYRMEKIHLAQGTCWQRVREEISYWGLSDHVTLDACCLSRAASQDEKRDMLRHLTRQLEDCCSVMPDMTSHNHTVSRRREKIRVFLENPMSSTAAKIWSAMFMAVVILSSFIQVVVSVPEFRKPITTPKWNITTESNAKLIMYATTEVHPTIIYFENGCFVIFFIELVLRFFVSHSKLQFVRSVYNIIDVLATLPLPMLAVLRVLDSVEDNYHLLTLGYVLSVLGFFRVLRIFKLVRHVTGVRVLLVSLKASLPEIGLLLLILMLAMLLFSNLIYFAELYVEDQFESIPIGFWWSIVTMTTVGYGDKHPKSAWGYVIGALCAVCGMLLIGIPIPAIANNFNALYRLARRRDVITNKQNSLTSTAENLLSVRIPDKRGYKLHKEFTVKTLPSMLHTNDESVARRHSM